LKFCVERQEEIDENASIELLFTYQKGIRTERENILHNRENAGEFRGPECHQHSYMMTCENDMVAEGGGNKKRHLGLHSKRELK